MRADRLLSLLLLLQARGRMTARELAERLEVSERTVYRDVAALGMAGVPVYAERGPGGGCSLLEGYRTNLTGLTEEDVRTLFLSGAPGLLNDLGMSGALEAAALKLIAALPASYRQHIEHARQRIHVDPVGWSQADEAVPHLAVLQHAVLNERRLRLRYRKANGELVERLLDPLGLVAKAAIWYLVGRYTTSAAEMRVFRVSRVLEATPLDEGCERPPNFDLAAYWQTWSAEFAATFTQYAVKVRAQHEALPDLPVILGDWIVPLTEQTTPEPNGSIILSLNYDSIEHARSRLLPLGTLVEVIAPLELRESIITYAEGVAAFYAERQCARTETRSIGSTPE